MRISSLRPVLLLLALSLAPLSRLPAQTPAQDPAPAPKPAPKRAARAPQVVLVSPLAGQPLFGQVEIRVEVRGASVPVKKVEFYFDSVRVAIDETPPFHTVVDAGQRNAEHFIDVVAHGPSGPIGNTSLRSLPLQVDEVIEVGLRQLYVIAERGGRRVTDLERDDFIVLDNGVPQNLITFERGEIPFTATLLLDASASMRGGRLETALEGVKAFTRRMDRLDEAKLVLFSDRVLLETPFTSVASILTLGLGEAKAEGGTALNDAFYLALKRMDGRQGRKVLVLLTDGVDVESVVSMEQVQRIARQSQAVLYWLRLRREGEEENGPLQQIYTAWRDAEGHRREIDLLRSTILESGGQILTLDGVEQVQQALATVLHELRDQYVLGYYPSQASGPGRPGDSSGGWHDLEVRVRGEAVKIRTQEGYLEK